MANLNTVLSKAMELRGRINGLLQLSAYRDFYDLSELNIDHKDKDQLFLLDELSVIMEKLADVEDKLKYLSQPIGETSRLHKNESGRYETKRGHYYTCGCGIEAIVSDDRHEAPYWMHTRVEHNGKNYYLVGSPNVSFDGLTVRVRKAV